MQLSPLSWPILLDDAKKERRHVLTDLSCLEISTTLTKGTMGNERKSFYTRTSRAVPKYLK